MSKIGILRVDLFEYEGIDDLRKKLVTLKKVMAQHNTTNNSIGATATAYNIIHMMRQIERIEHKSKTMSDSARLKIRMRTKILDSISKSSDPVETLQELLKDLG